MSMSVLHPLVISCKGRLLERGGPSLLGSIELVDEHVWRLRVSAGAVAELTVDLCSDLLQRCLDEHGEGLEVVKDAPETPDHNGGGHGPTRVVNVQYAAHAAAHAAAPQLPRGFTGVLEAFAFQAGLELRQREGRLRLDHAHAPWMWAEAALPLGRMLVACRQANNG